MTKTKVIKRQVDAVDDEKIPDQQEEEEKEEPKIDQVHSYCCNSFNSLIVYLMKNILPRAQNSMTHLNVRTTNKKNLLHLLKKKKP